MLRFITKSNTDGSRNQGKGQGQHDDIIDGLKPCDRLDQTHCGPNYEVRPNSEVLTVA